MTAPVQRTETCPPVTMTVRSRGVGELGVVWLGGAGEGDGVVELAELVVVGVDVEAEGAGVDRVVVELLAGVVVPTVGPSDRVKSELESPPLMSRPARSMANQAVADTPATVASQIIAMPMAERSFTNTSSPSCLHLRCHRRVDTPPTGYRAVVATILLIEDDNGIRSAITRALTDLGHAVTSSNRGMSGLESAVDNQPDVVLLDLGLPDIDGLQVLAMLRAVSAVPIIIITARDDDADMVRALDGGADDYVVKPFGIEQVEARLRAVLRRSGSTVTEGPLVVGGLTIDPRKRLVNLDRVPIDLSRKEFDLLLALAQRPGEVVTKRELLADVWRQSYGGGDRTVDVHLSWLRRKLGETAADPRYLHSVRGVGVRLAAPDDASDGQ